MKRTKHQTHGLASAQQEEEQANWGRKFKTLLDNSQIAIARELLTHYVVFFFPRLLRFPPAWPASLRNHGVLRDRSCGREARRSLKSFDFQPWGRRIRPRDCVFGTATKSYRGGWNARPHGWLADLLRGRLKMALPNMLVLQSKAMTIFQSEPLAESGPAANIQKPFWAVPTQTQY